MKTFSEIIPISRKITKEHDVCNNCLGRLFSKSLNLSSNKTLGNRIHSKLQIKSKKCYICKNILDNFGQYIDKLNELSGLYHYDTFVIGTIVQPSIIDRDDNIRSKFKLRGVDSIKSDITHQLSKLYAKKSKKQIDFLDPDITFIINFKNNSCEVRSKSMHVQGRYTKNLRGFPQKQTSCSNCKGKGCVSCKFHGITNFDSVEGQISKLFFDKFDCGVIKFTWLGGEDKSSLVLGSGRPFFAKIHNPKKRRVRFSKIIQLDNIVLNDIKIISERPTFLPKFSSLVRTKIKTNYDLDSKNLKPLKNITKNKVVVYDTSGKRSEKSVTSIKYKKKSNNEFSLTFKADGGLPIKRFVEGKEVVPNVSDVIKNSCTCKEFDFLEVYAQ